MKKWTGYLGAVCEKKGRRSILKESYYEGAYKITRPVYLDHSGQACLYIMNPGGGYIDGDAYRMEIELEEGAEVLLTTQSSTKIYKTITRPVVQSMDVTLKRGSLLEYFPDPVIAYQHARFKQETVVRMEQGASLICTDIFTPGWAPDGSFFRYDLLQSRMKVYLDERLILQDLLRLEPDHEIHSLGNMEGFTHLGSMIIIHESINEECVDEFYQMLSSLSEIRAGISLLSIPGAAIRIMGHRTQDIEEGFSQCSGWLRENKFNREKVFLRKY